MSTARGTGALAITAAIIALVGNALAPRFNGDDVVVYHKIANSTRYAVAGVVVLAALALVTAAFAALSRIDDSDGQRSLRDGARLATIVGGAIALGQAAVQIYAY